MAGSELSGIGSAKAEILQDAFYFLTPIRKAPQKALAFMEEIVRSIGAYPLRIDALEHAKIMAPLSHLPQLVSVVLVKVLESYSSEKNKLGTLAGGGFKDTTRIAAGDPHFWRDIFFSNKQNVKESLRLFCNEVELFLDCLEQGDEKGIYEFLNGAAFFRRSLK